MKKKRKGYSRGNNIKFIINHIQAASQEAQNKNNTSQTYNQKKPKNIETLKVRNLCLKRFQRIDF